MMKNLIWKFIPRKLNDEWEPTINIRIKDYECFALGDLCASVSTIPKTLCDILGSHDLDVFDCGNPSQAPGTRVGYPYS